MKINKKFKFFRIGENLRWNLYLRDEFNVIIWFVCGEVEEGKGIIVVVEMVVGGDVGWRLRSCWCML